ncbi:Guanine nucleotide exchange factor for Cdc42p [Stygiomarasmius scandens]|uniref:Guanine nucleotide exchange factor for Cdc42p n=1 Tax=Marasmiellus scandens TaxID=2682957 RepID=A0ABR1J1P4_9AGAR
MKPTQTVQRSTALPSLPCRFATTRSLKTSPSALTVTDLWDRGSTNGLVKVIKTLKAIVNHLSPDTFEDTPPSPPYLASHDSYSSLGTDLHSSLPPANAQEAARNKIVRIMVETERKYVQDLEIMQKYSIKATLSTKTPSISSFPISTSS